MNIYEKLANAEHRKLELEREIASMDYLSLKHADGCDMREYDDVEKHPEYGGDWLAKKQEIRKGINQVDQEITKLREEIKALEDAEVKPMEENNNDEEINQN